MAVGDLNGDQLPDIVVTGDNQPGRVLFNDGNGSFTLDGTQEFPGSFPDPRRIG